MWRHSARSGTPVLICSTREIRMNPASFIGSQGIGLPRRAHYNARTERNSISFWGTSSADSPVPTPDRLRYRVDPRFSTLC